MRVSVTVALAATLLLPCFALAAKTDPAEAKPAVAVDEAVPGDAKEGEAEAAGDGLPPELKAMVERMAKLESKTGKVTVDGKADIDLPAGYEFYGKDDAQFIVEKMWGNPPDPSVIGLITPASKDDEDGDEGEAAAAQDGEAKEGEEKEGAGKWGIVITYDDMGHVEDDDAADIDYEDLLKEMREGEDEANARRKAAGYSTVHLIGWAEPPHYDAQAKKLYWAKSLQFEGEPEETLNYDVRILGRRGVLVLTAIASVKDLKSVAEAAKGVLAKTEFVNGERYADYDSGLDKVAAVGIGGLVAGKVLAKAGILKVLLKPLLLVGAAVVGFIGKMFGKKNSEG